MKKTLRIPELSLRIQKLLKKMNHFIRNCLFAVLAIFFFCLCNHLDEALLEEPEYEETVLKVASFNTGHFNMGALGGYQGTKVEETLSHWRDWISGQQFDILFLQEWNLFFDKNRKYTAQTELLDPFYEYIFWGDLQDWVLNGICTNLTARDAQVKYFHGYYYAVVAYTNFSGKTVALISAHLSRDIHLHKSDIQQFIEFLGTFDCFVAGGDLNATQEDHLLFKDAGYHIANGGINGFFKTFPGYDPVSDTYNNSYADNIITSADIEIRNPFTITTNLNDHDHLPVIAEVVIQSPVKVSTSASR